MTSTIVLGSVGIGLTNVAAGIADAANAALKDIESQLSTQELTLTTYETVFNERHTALKMDQVNKLPRSTINGLWRRAAEDAIGELLNEGEPRLLAGHPVYFSSLYKIFSSPASVAVLKGATPSRVVLLIDDIFDMYIRLATPRSIFSVAAIREFLGDVERHEGVALASMSRRELAELTMAARLQHLHLLLSWRQIEIVVAEMLANDLGCTDSRFVIWGLRQNAAALEAIVANESQKVVYLSHPITEPRRIRNSGSAWPDLYRELQQLQALLIENGISLQAPTSIDELRFASERFRLTGELTPRWPNEEVGDSLYHEPGSESGPDYSDLLRPQYLNLQTGELELLQEDPAWLSPALYALREEIKLQLATRDFMLTAHADAVLVYRPLFGEPLLGRFSGGVAGELALCERLYNAGSSKRVAIVHFVDDVRALVAKNGKQLRATFISHLASQLRERFDFNRNEVIEALVANQAIGGFGSALLPVEGLVASDVSRLTDFIQENWGALKEIALLIELSGIRSPVRRSNIWDSCGIWIVRDFDELQGELPAIGGFLGGQDSDHGNRWKRLVNDFIPDDTLRSSS